MSIYEALSRIWEKTVSEIGVVKPPVDVKAAQMGRWYKLENGGAVAIFDSSPEGFYAFQIHLVPTGEMQFFLSNQGAAALFVLLWEEYMNGNLAEGMEKMPRKKEARDE